MFKNLFEVLKVISCDLGGLSVGKHICELDNSFESTRTCFECLKTYLELETISLGPFEFSNAYLRDT